ncbi:hypothetical protein SMICM17S_05980 [Streptomyces microflavus]
MGLAVIGGLVDDVEVRSGADERNHPYELADGPCRCALLSPAALAAVRS